MEYTGKLHIYCFWMVMTFRSSFFEYKLEIKILLIMYENLFLIKEIKLNLREMKSVQLLNNINFMLRNGKVTTTVLEIIKSNWVDFILSI